MNHLANKLNDYLSKEKKKIVTMKEIGLLKCHKILNWDFLHVKLRNHIS